MSTHHAAYLNRESVPHGTNRFAQIVVYKKSQKNVGEIEFNVTFDSAVGFGYKVVVCWQRAGEYKRKTHHRASAAMRSYYGPCQRVHVTQRWSRMQTASGAARFHQMGTQIAYVQLEESDLVELDARLDANQCRDDRSGILLDYAAELTNGQVGEHFGCPTGNAPAEVHPW